MADAFRQVYCDLVLAQAEVRPQDKNLALLHGSSAVLSSTYFSSVLICYVSGLWWILLVFIWYSVLVVLFLMLCNGDLCLIL